MQEKENVYARLEQIRKERKVINSDIIKFLLELKEFKKYIHEESYKINVSFSYVVLLFIKIKRTCYK